MAYTDDLLAQADELVRKDPRRPKQASLRRAVSAAYYAMFHEVSDRAIGAFLSKPLAGGLVGDRLRRVVQHANALKAAKWFSGHSVGMPSAVQSMRAAPTATPPSIDPDLTRVCRVFADLQAERHRADYQLEAPFSRADAHRLVCDARSAVQKLRRLPLSSDVIIFLLGCLVGDSLTRNS